MNSSQFVYPVPYRWTLCLFSFFYYYRAIMNDLKTHFECFQVYLQDQFPEMDLLGERTYTFVIFVDIAVLHSHRQCQVHAYFPTASPIVCYQTFRLLPIWQVKKMAFLIMNEKHLYFLSINCVFVSFVYFSIGFLSF